MFPEFIASPLDERATFHPCNLVVVTEKST